MGTVLAKGHPENLRTTEVPIKVKTKEETNIDPKDHPVKVVKVLVNGLNRTKNDIVVQQLQDIFGARNFEELLKTTQQAKMDMERLGLFKKVNILIDIDKEGKLPDGYVVNYEVQEQKRITGGLSTLVGTNEGSLLFVLKFPNLLGRGEKVATEFTYGTKKAHGNSLSFSKPLFGNPNIFASAGLFQYSGEYPWSGYRETDRGLFADLTFPSVYGSHSIKWEGVWRDLQCGLKSAMAVREQSGHSTKSCLKHTFARDKRDERILPNSGYCVRVTQEIAGFGGDTHFFKNDAEVQANFPLPFDIVLQGSFATGVLKMLRPGETSKISDRFFLGGPLTLRGFEIKGVGPSQNGYGIGSNFYWLGGLHLYTPLPFRPGKDSFGDLFRTHAFINTGSLSLISGDDDLSRTWEDIRISYGFGVVLKLGGVARLELNYCIPFKYQPGDKTVQGLQFGVGINFL